jgi:phosphoglycerate dehydrogenase-like enzyme
MVKVLASGRLDASWVERFASAYDFTYLEWDDGSQPSAPEALIALIGDTQVLITEAENVGRTVIEGCPNLVAIVDTRAAPVNVDIQAATDHGVVVINTPGRNADAVGDLTVALMVMVARDIWPAMMGMRNGTWKREGQLANYLSHQGVELPGKTVGLVALGATGRAVAKRLAGFGVRLIAYDPFATPEGAAALGIELVDLDTLLATSDFVSLHAPVTTQTKGMIGARELALMRPTAYLVNVARAALVDQEAMLDALQTRQIAGAALDVYDPEPLPDDHPLYALDNVFLVPHLGGASREVADHQSQLAWDGLAAFIDGRQFNVVNPAAFDRAHARLASTTG